MHFKITTKKNLYQLRLEKIKLGDTWTVGTMNRTQDGLYVPYLDYDFMEEQYITEEIAHLQEMFNLGNIHIFQSSPKRFHIIGFTKMAAREFVELMINSSCDEAFKNVPRFYSIRNWVLRCFDKGKKEKPKYLYTLYHRTTRKESEAHYKYLRMVYPEVNNTIQNPDGLSKIKLISYLTAERKK